MYVRHGPLIRSVIQNRMSKGNVATTGQEAFCDVLVGMAIRYTGMM